MRTVDRNKILKLPVCVRSWIILNEYIHENADFQVFGKIFKEYALERSVKDMAEVMKLAEYYFEKEEVSELFELYLRASIDKQY